MATRPMQVWNGSAWEDIGPQAPATAIVVQSSTPTGDSGKLWIDTSADVPTYANMAPTASPSFTGTSTFAGPVTMSGGAVNMSGATSVTGGGMDLITPTSVAGSGVTLSGAQINFAAATTMSANGVFTSAYDNYMIQFNATAATLADNITCRLRVSSTDASTNYKSSIAYMAYASNAVAGLAYGATQWEPGRASATLGSSFVMWIQSPAVAARTMMNYLTNDADTNSRIGGGLHSTATAYDGITFAIATGNLTGTLRIYGLRNS